MARGGCRAAPAAVSFLKYFSLSRVCCLTPAKYKYDAVEEHSKEEVERKKKSSEEQMNNKNEIKNKNRANSEALLETYFAVTAGIY